MIVFRDLNQEDVACLVQFLNNKKVTRFLTSRIAQPYTATDASWWVETGSKQGVTKAIEYQNTFVGIIGATTGVYEDRHSAEIGYWLAEQYWGQGIATQAINKMTNYMFEQTDVVRMFAPVFDPNKNSMRVLEKSGYRQEAILTKAAYKNGKYYDKHIFAKIK